MSYSSPNPSNIIWNSEYDINIFWHICEKVLPWYINNSKILCAYKTLGNRSNRQNYDLGTEWYAVKKMFKVNLIVVVKCIYCYNYLHNFINNINATLTHNIETNILIQIPVYVKIYINFLLANVIYKTYVQYSNWYTECNIYNTHVKSLYRTCYLHQYTHTFIFLHIFFCLLKDICNSKAQNQWLYKW